MEDSFDIESLRIFFYVTLLPLLPIFHLVEWGFNKMKEEKERKFIPFSFWYNGVPIIFCLSYVVLVFLPLMDIGQWDAAQSIVDLLTKILQFLLPLQIVAAITRNRTGIASYTKFTRRMLQLRHHLGTKISGKASYIFQIIAKAAKWEIRGNLIITLLPGENNVLGDKIKNVRNMLDVLYEEIKTNGEGMSKPREAAAYKVLNDAIAAYGEMKSLNDFKIPVLFISFFYVCLTGYFICLPFTFADEDAGTQVVKCIVNLYVFLGMFNIAVYISNPFRSSTKVLQTVSKIEADYKDIVQGNVNTQGLQTSLQFRYVKLKV